MTDVCVLRCTAGRRSILSGCDLARIHNLAALLNRCVHALQRLPVFWKGRLNWYACSDAGSAIDFEATAEERALQVRQGYSTKLDELRNTYDGMQNCSVGSC